MKLEKGLIILVIIAVILKFNQLSGGEELLVFSLTSLSILYPLGGYYMAKKTPESKQTQSILRMSGICFSIVPIGILFRLQFWPMSYEYILTGLISAGVITLISFIYRSRSKPEFLNYHNMVFTRAIFFTVIVFGFFITPLETIIKIQYRNDQEMVRLATLHYQNPGDEEIRMDFFEYQVKKGYMEKNPLLDK